MHGNRATASQQRSSIALGTVDFIAAVMAEAYEPQAGLNI